MRIIKIPFSEIPRPRELKNLRKKGIPLTQRDWNVDYIRDPGQTDDFPDFWSQSIFYSPVGTAVNRRLADFIGGKGFAQSSLSAKMVNESETLLDLHEKIVQDYVLYGRFAVRIIPVRSGKNYALEHIPAGWIRYAWEKEYGGYMEDIRGCWCMPFINSSEDKRIQAEYLPLWNGKDSFREGRDMVEQMDLEYRGHIFFHNPPHPTNHIYSRPDLYSAERDILADGRVGEFFERLTANQFLPGGALTVFGDPNEKIPVYEGSLENDVYKTASEVLNEDLADHFSGTQNAGSLIVFWVQDQEQTPSISPFQVGNLHEMFLNANETIRSRIAMAAQIPEVLLGVQQAGSLGQNNELVTAIGFANESTRKKRKKLEEVYKVLLSGVRGINVKQLEIQPIQNFGDIPQYVFMAMTVKQKEEYMEKVYDIAPDPEGHSMPNEIIEVDETKTEEDADTNDTPNNNTGD